MAKFIEVTETNGNKSLVNTDLIMSVYDDMGVLFICMGTDSNGECIGILVLESYAEIRQKLCEV